MAWVRWHILLGTVLIMGHEWIHSEHFFTGEQPLWWFWEICVLGRDFGFSPVRSRTLGCTRGWTEFIDLWEGGSSANWGSLQFSKSIGSHCLWKVSGWNREHSPLPQTRLSCLLLRATWFSQCVVFESMAPFHRGKIISFCLTSPSEDLSCSLGVAG